MNAGGSEMEEESQRMEEPSHFETLQAVDMSLTKEQYMVLQHMLPKKYALIEHRHIKKGGVITSAIKLGPEDVYLPLDRPKICPECRATPRMSKAEQNELGLRRLISFWRSLTGPKNSKLGQMCRWRRIYPSAPILSLSY